AGLLVGGMSMGTAKAADLGGDCCADLEERVADLEATTVRKGNRKVSLTLSGQIDKQIMYMSDDRSSRTIAGVDNINSSTRFLFSGNAKITSSVTAGFEMMMEWSGSSRSDKINQVTTLGDNWNLTNSSGDGSLSVRTANWWLEDKALGRVTVGRVNIQGPASIIDISGGDVQLVAWSNPSLQGGGLYLAADGGGNFYSNTLGNLAPYCYGCSREEGIRYDSASIGGLLLGAYWGEQDRFSVQARYAGEFAGFQIAAGAGYQHDNNLATTGVSKRTDVEQQAYALSVKHIATGIFVQANTGKTNWKLLNNVSGKSDGTMWQVQGGIAKNWFGPGVTALYGEYGRAEGYASDTAAADPVTGVATSLGGTITSDSVDYYGLGVTQKIDAAAMTLYLGWRHFDPKISVNGVDRPLSEIDTVIGGARIQF
ncbi:MAG: porin, partial [Hyphomicrobiaceae bacterium]|nr:porin [Hyphomicrobiaceae bacterium]